MPKKQDNVVNLDEWYTNEQAVERLSENAGRLIDENYPRTLARYGKVRSFNIGKHIKLYFKEDINAYRVSDKVGRKRKNESGKTVAL